MRNIQNFNNFLAHLEKIPTLIIQSLTEYENKSSKKVGNRLCIIYNRIKDVLPGKIKEGTYLIVSQFPSHLCPQIKICNCCSVYAYKCRFLGSPFMQLKFLESLFLSLLFNVFSVLCYFQWEIALKMTQHKLEQLFSFKPKYCDTVGLRQPECSHIFIFYNSLILHARILTVNGWATYAWLTLLPPIIKVHDGAMLTT